MFLIIFPARLAAAGGGSSGGGDGDGALVRSTTTLTWAAAPLLFVCRKFKYKSPPEHASCLYFSSFFSSVGFLVVHEPKPVKKKTANFFTSHYLCLKIILFPTRRRAFNIIYTKLGRKANILPCQLVFLVLSPGCDLVQRSVGGSTNGTQQYNKNFPAICEDYNPLSRAGLINGAHRVIEAVVHQSAQSQPRGAQLPLYNLIK